jgi:hypothetical protein
MIDPITGLTVIAGLGNLFGGAAASRKMNKINKQIAERTQREAARASVQMLTGLSIRQRQGDTAAGQKQAALARQARTATAEQVAGAAAAGVEGRSVSAVAQDYMRQENLRAAVIGKEREYELLQLQEQREGIVAQAQSRINQAQPQVTPEPNILGGLLQVGAQGLASYAAGFQAVEGGGFRNIYSGKTSTSIF